MTAAAGEEDAGVAVLAAHVVDVDVVQPQARAAHSCHFARKLSQVAFAHSACPPVPGRKTPE